MFDVSGLSNKRFSGPRSILRLVQLFAKLSAHPEGQTLAQLCERLALPKTTLFTMLKVLEGAGYVVSDNGLYRLGTEAALLGAAMAESPRRSFPDCARGALETLCRTTGETGFLAVLTPDNLHCRYVAVVESENWLRFSVKLGSQRPSYATGTGRAMLAYLPKPEIDELLRRVRFEKVTPRTLSSRRALLAGLAQVRAQSISVVDSGTVNGVVSIAAPIFGMDGVVRAAVSAGGPSERVLGHQRSVERAVRACAEEISRILGFRGQWPQLPPR
jgi:IclR family KDG regulon transcriptional repressor